MENNTYSNADILDLLFVHGRCNGIISGTCRVFNETCPNLPLMSRKMLRRILNNQLEFGRISAERILPKPITSNEDNVINVLAYFNVHPESSTRAAEYDLGISQTSIHRILRTYGMHPYKFKLLSALRPGDPEQRVQFCETMLVRYQEDPQFLRDIIWTDESKFSREGIFNRQNTHLWSSENPHAIRERNFQNKFSVNVFCLIKDNRIAYHIYEENLNANRYLNILQTVVADFLDEIPLAQLRRCWYQLDGAPPHCHNQIDQQLTQMFEDRWMRRLGPWNWPVRSPDLTPLDFYVWGVVKQRVYSTPVVSREDLIARIRRAFHELPADNISKAVTDGVISRIHKCLTVNGGHIEHL